MLKNKCVKNLALCVLSFFASYSQAMMMGGGHSSSGVDIAAARDVNPDPNVFETYIEAAPHQMTLSSGETVTVFAYNGQVPGPQINVKQGDRVIVHLTNKLPAGFSTTIHWHGIELNNKSDGTPATQAEVPPGGSYTYDFLVPRGGVFWYHPHIRGGQEVIAGLYGPLIVKEDIERDLVSNGILPSKDMTLVLSDISVTEGQVKDVENVPMLETMNGTEGDILLVNGKQMPTIRSEVGKGLRLRLINTSITRYYRLSLPGHTIYRVGGEGGLIADVRAEGGPVMGMRMAMSETYDGYTGMIMVDQGYDKGEILLAPAQRADVVVVPNGSSGDTLTMQWKDFARGRHMMVMTPMGMMMTEAEDDGLRPSIDLFNIELYRKRHSMWWGGYDDDDDEYDHDHDDSYSISEGMALRANPGRLMPERQDSQIKLQADMMAMMMGMPKEKWFKIDDYSGVDGRTNYRTASVGEVLKWETHNHTDMHHPFHLHGFSFQPVMYMTMHHEEGYMDMWNVNAENEYVDTVNVPPHTSVFYLFEVEDRPVYAAQVGDSQGGGAAGDWVFHCHIFQHGENGMMSFLRVAE